MSAELRMAMRKGDKLAIAAKKKELISLDKEIASKLLAFNEVKMLYGNSDPVKFYQALADFAIKYDFDQSESLNKYAWMLAEAKEDISKNLIAKALKMAKRSVELDANFANIDTYACLLNRAGMTDQAKVQAKKAVELAPKEQKKGLWSSTFMAGN